MRFDWDTLAKPIPQPIASLWIVGILVLGLWTVFKFYILRDVKNDVPQLKAEQEKLCKGSDGEESNGVLIPNNNNSMELRFRGGDSAQ